MQIDAGGSLTGHGTLTSTITDAGALIASGGTLILKGAVSGAGTLSAAAGALLTITKGSSFAGAISGAGTVAISAATTLNAGASLAVANLIDTANLTLANGVALTNALGDSFALTAASGTITLGGGTTGSLSNAGSLIAGGAGTEQIGIAVINSGNISANAGTLTFLNTAASTGTLTNTGTINASAGLINVNTAIAGTGLLDIGATGTLSLLNGAGAGQSLHFLATTGLLDLTAPSTFLGTITGFGASDQIDLVKTLETAGTSPAACLPCKTAQPPSPALTSPELTPPTASHSQQTDTQARSSSSRRHRSIRPGNLNIAGSDRAPLRLVGRRAGAVGLSAGDGRQKSTVGQILPPQPPKPTLPMRRRRECSVFGPSIRGWCRVRHETLRRFRRVWRLA